MRQDRTFGRKLLGFLLRERHAGMEQHERMVGRLLTASLERERMELLAAIHPLAEVLSEPLPAGVDDEVPVCPDCGCADGEQATWEGGDGVWFMHYACTCDCHYGGSAA